MQEDPCQPPDSTTASGVQLLVLQLGPSRAPATLDTPGPAQGGCAEPEAHPGTQTLAAMQGMAGKADLTTPLPFLWCT